MKKSGCAQCKKKMAKGGVTGSDVVGMPGYSANPRVYSGQMLKKGGTASLPKCTDGLVRLPNGKCGKRQPPAFKAGGATKNAKLAQETKPYNKVTRGDVLKRILQKKGK